ncbi:MAG: DUF61 family protein [Candidatus Hadarchaeales archaeon]
MGAESLIEAEIRRINSHLPKERISLIKALKSERPEVETKSGSLHSIRKEEVRLLSEIVPEETWGELMLPIIIWLDRKMGSGAAVIRGKAEVKAVASLLGKKACEGDMVIYGHEVSVLRNRLPTATQYAFSGG